MARARKAKLAPTVHKPRAAKSKRKKAPEQPASALLSAETEDTTSPTTAQSASIMLPENMDSAAAESLKDLLLSARGQRTEVDASQVRRVGAQSLQVLVAASRTWVADGYDYALVNPSEELSASIALLGLATEELSIRGM